MLCTSPHYNLLVNPTGTVNIQTLNKLQSISVCFINATEVEETVVEYSDFRLTSTIPCTTFHFSDITQTRQKPQTKLCDKLHILTKA